MIGAPFLFPDEAVATSRKKLMPTAKKEATIEELRAKLADSKNLFFTNYAGLTVEEITKSAHGIAQRRVDVLPSSRTRCSRAPRATSWQSKIDALSRRTRRPSIFAPTIRSRRPRRSSRSATTSSRSKSKARYIDGQHRRFEPSRRAGVAATQSRAPRQGSRTAQEPAVRSRHRARGQSQRLRPRPQFRSASKKQAAESAS